jgi:hypothetical protein
VYYSLFSTSLIATINNIDTTISEQENHRLAMAIDQQFFDKLAGVYQGRIPQFPWYCYAVVVFQVHDKMDFVGQTWRYVLEQTKEEDDGLRIARQMREALLKASVLVGFPKVSF